MKIIILLFLTIVVSGCLNAPVNKKVKKKTPNLCMDKNSTNYSKALPCVCSVGYELSSDKKTCIEIKVQESVSRSCTNQPINTIGGEEISLDNGQNWSECINPICNDKSILINGNCEIKDQTRVCSVSNGSGSQKTENGGQTWSQCSPNICNPSYILQNNTCVLAKISRVCSINNGTGLQYSDNAGVVWGSCIPSSCNPQYTLINGLCKPLFETRSCIVENGIGSQSTNDAGQNWSKCAIVSCNSGFNLVGDSCKFMKVYRSCSVANGVGSQYQSEKNGLWSSCSVSNCNAGYTLLNNSCQLSTISRACTNQPINSTGGYEISNDAGQHWESGCKSFSCVSNATMVNGQCILKVVETNILDIQYYVKKFEQVSNLMNKALIVDINISLTNDFASTGVLGTCTYANPRFVKINQSWWNSQSTTNSSRQYVMFHELGHCMLNRIHKTEMVALADDPLYSVPVSMMYPAIMLSQIYNNNADYYHQELFDETISTQNMPLYYNSQVKNSLALMMDLVEPIKISTSSSKMTNGKIVCNDSEASF